MAIEFQGNDIKCADTHTTLTAVRGPGMTQRTYFWGLKGVSEIRGTPNVDEITCKAWLHDEAFTGVGGANAMYDYIRDLGRLRTEHGTLKQKGVSNNEDYKNCTFDGYELLTPPGHDEPTIFQDVSGLLNNSWIAIVFFRWTMLRDDP